MEIERDGKKIELTDREVELAYREKELAYRAEDAKNEWDFYYGDEAPLTQDEAEPLAQEFIDNYDCSLSENDQWVEILDNFYYGERLVEEAEGWFGFYQHEYAERMTDQDYRDLASTFAKTYAGYEREPNYRRRAWLEACNQYANERFGAGREFEIPITVIARVTAKSEDEAKAILLNELPRKTGAIGCFVFDYGQAIEDLKKGGK